MKKSKLVVQRQTVRALTRALQQVTGGNGRSVVGCPGDDRSEVVCPNDDRSEVVCPVP